MVPALLWLAALGAIDTVDLYLVRDVDTEPCGADCWSALARKMKSRTGVKKVVLEDSAARVTVSTKGLRVPRLVAGLEGFKAEMRAGYTGAEVRIEPDAFFPPIIRPEAGMVVLPLGPEVQSVIEEAVGFRLQPRMKCVGRLKTPASGELFLSRFEAERRAPTGYLPFEATPDFNGDGKLDLYLRLNGLPELVVLGRPGSLKAMATGPRNPNEYVRCDLDPERFSRVVPKKKARCVSGGGRPAGDAVERVVWNQSAELLFHDGKKFATCQPVSTGPAVAEGFEEAPKKGKSKISVMKGGKEDE